MILNDSPCNCGIRDIAADRPPRLAPVSTFKQVGIEVAIFVIVQDDKNGIGIKQVRFDVVDKCCFRYTGQGTYFDLLPGYPTISGYLEKAIISSCIDQPFSQRRLSQ